VDGVTSDGRGVGRLQGLAVFVEGALPGELVLARITGRKKNYALARTLRVLEASPGRAEPSCPWYDVCGGCSLQHADYQTELEIKLYKLGFSPDPETGRFSVAYKILNLDADSPMDILLDQFEAFLNTVASAMDLLSYRLISEEEVVVLFNQMAENMERSYQDMAYADVTEKQLQRFQQLEQRVNQLEQQFNW